MRVDVLTLFPEIFTPLGRSIIKRAQDADLVQINLHQIRDFATDRHKTVDEPPYGGGAGMILKPEPIYRALKAIQAQDEVPGKVILLSPQGRVLKHEIALELSGEPRLILICGHYEGVDERVRECMVDMEISIGDYVLTGGELPAMVVIDAVVRLIPGVVAQESLKHESFSFCLLDYPQYTRPKEFNGMKVPEVLLSGHHAEIEKWRRREAIRRTFLRRPDLLPLANLSREEQEFLVTLQK